MSGLDAAYSKWQRNISILAAWKDKVTNAEGRARTEQHTERKKILLAWICDANGSPARTTASIILAGTRIQEMTS